MHVLLIHPNYHSGGAEIAGNWPPAWVAYLAGSLKSAGYDKVTFLDAMTNHMSDEELRTRMIDLAPDIVGVTSITPSIYKAESVLEIAREAVPDALRVLGGVHATFMYKQVLSEAPWIDVIVRGEGEEIVVTLNSLQGSGSLPSFVGVNALAILPADRAEFAGGDRVEIFLWGQGLRGPDSFFDQLG